MATTLIQPKEVINGGIVRPAPADVRFDALLLSPHIQDAEARFVIPVLTSAFYYALIAEKGTTESNYNPAFTSTAAAFSTTAYEALWTDHLRDYCAACVLYESLPFVGVQTGANGLYLNDSEFGRNAGIDGVKFMQDTLMTKIQVKERRLKEYLCTCAAALPAFSSSAAGYCPSSGCPFEDDTPATKLGIILY